MSANLKVAVVGAGWAGLAAAVTASQAGHQVTLFEASQTLGGRARALPAHLPDGAPLMLDNGQHILLDAYCATLNLMQTVGVAPEAVLLKLPLRLQFPNGCGLRLPSWGTPLDLLAGVLLARGWSLADKYALLRTGISWQRQGFVCAEDLNVASLCQHLTQRLQAELIEPLCVSALNTPPQRASASVFLRLLQDALFGAQGTAKLLLPCCDLGSLLPQAAASWLQQRGHKVLLRTTVDGLQRLGHGWRLSSSAGQEPSAALDFDAVIWASAPTHAIKVLEKYHRQASASEAQAVANWLCYTQALEFEAIATVYAWSSQARLNQPMLMLRSSPEQPAQFVFDRAQLGAPAGVLAFVVSAAVGTRTTLQAQVLAQAKAQLGLDLQALQTVIEKRATFACTPNLQRPSQYITAGLLACGDYVAGPYPATLEGAVRSGISSAQALGQPA